MEELRGFQHEISTEQYDDLIGEERETLSRIADAAKAALEQSFGGVIVDIEVAEDGYVLRSRRAMTLDKITRLHDYADGIVVGFMAGRSFRRSS
jgi:hypothetical protein